MGKKHFMTIAAALFLGAGLLSAQRPGQQVKRDEVHQDTLMKHVMELSSETYRGRLAGTEGYDRAARYVQRVLQRYGLEQIEEMPFTVECNEVENAKFNVYRPGDKERRVFTLGNEFCCAGVTGRGYVDAQMVFCGYGIDHSDFDEYKYVDVKGKVAIVLTGLPEGLGLPEAVASHYITLRDRRAPPRSTVP